MLVLDRSASTAQMSGGASFFQSQLAAADRLLGELRPGVDVANVVVAAERATLMQKNEQVRARVEAMIGRLKAMESGA